MIKKFTVIKIRKQPSHDVNRELQWLGNSLGLFNLRDRDSSCFRVFITLVKQAKREKVLSSDEIAERLYLSRGTVVHHLNKLMNAGIAVREKGGYLLREGNLRDIIRDIKKDVDAVFSELQEVAEEIDDKLG